MGVEVVAVSPPVGTLGDALGATSVFQPGSTLGVSAPAVNVAAVVTFIPPAGQRVRLTKLTFGIGAAAPAASVVATVADGTFTETYDLPAAIGTVSIPEPAGGTQFVVGATVTITVPASGAAVLSRVNAARLIA